MRRGSRGSRPFYFLSIGPVSKKIGLSEQLRRHCRYRCADGGYLTDYRPGFRYILSQIHPGRLVTTPGIYSPFYSSMCSPSEVSSPGTHPASPASNFLSAAACRESRRSGLACLCYFITHCTTLSRAHFTFEHINGSNALWWMDIRKEYLLRQFRESYHIWPGSRLTMLKIQLDELFVSLVIVQSIIRIYPLEA
jgi:hypothetical protein